MSVRIKALLVVGLLSLVAGFRASDATASGTWGAADSPYLDGVVCTQGDGSSPLAAWDFGVGSPAFLLAPVTSAHGSDSLPLPYAATTRQQSAPVSAGTDGFGSAADLAAFAYLLWAHGTDETRTVAQVARAVMARQSDAGVPDCVEASGDLLADARRFAGPYQVRVTSPSGPLTMGVPTRLSATVLSAQGQPVPGVSVEFSSPDATFSSGAVTDSSGVAGASITVRAGTTAANITVDASARAPTGLREIVGYRPDGTRTVAAVYPDAPSPAPSTASITVDATAAPAAQPHSSSQLVMLGQSFQQSAAVTGLRGHSASVAFATYGPVPFDPSGGCPASGFTDASPVAVRSGSVTAVGDQTVAAASWQPSLAGCYSIRASVTTIDARPPATAQSVLGARDSIVAVVSAKAQVHPSHDVFGIGTVTASAAVDASSTLPGTVSGTLVGPVIAAGPSCAAADFSRAPTAAEIAPTPLAAAESTPVTTTAVPAPGCYQLRPSVRLTIGSLGSLAVPVAPSALLVVKPVLHVSVDQIWSLSPSPIQARVDVQGVPGLAAHLSVELAYAPISPTGCLSVDWSHRDVGPAGGPVPITGNTDRVALRSSPAARFGCYLPIARLSIDANPAIVATESLADPTNAVTVGVDPNARERLGGGVGSTHPLFGSTVLIGVVAGLESVIVALVVVTSRRFR